jgi:large subunit ribosomal protein L31
MYTLIMRSGIHPEYNLCHVKCSCGNQFDTRSTREKIQVEVCSECHPFITGKQRLIDTGGRVERFRKRNARRAK